MSTYESARKSGKSKESSAKIAYGALNRESLSLSSVFGACLLEAYPPSRHGTAGGSDKKKILFKDIVPELENMIAGADWKKDMPELAKHLDAEGDVTEGDLSRLTKPFRNALVNHGWHPDGADNLVKKVIQGAAMRAQKRAGNPHQEVNPYAEPDPWKAAQANKAGPDPSYVGSIKALKSWLGDYKMGNSIHHTAPPEILRIFKYFNWEIPKIEKFMEDLERNNP